MMYSGDTAMTCMMRPSCILKCNSTICRSQDYEVVYYNSCLLYTAQVFVGGGDRQPAYERMWRLVNSRSMGLNCL